MARKMYDPKGRQGAERENAPQGWYRISTYAGPETWEQMSLVKTGNSEDGSRYAIIRFPVLEPTDQMLQYLPREEICTQQDADAIPIMLIHPLDAGVKDELGNYICRDFSSTTVQWLSKFGASLSGLVLSRPDADVWDDIVWLLRNGARREAVVNVWQKGWPSWGQGPSDKELLAVFAGFQHYDYQAKRAVWQLEKGQRPGTDGEIRERHLVPPLFRVVAPSLMAGTILSYPWLNFPVVKTEDDGVTTFGGGGSRARFPPFCSTVGVDIETVLHDHEEEALAILEDDSRSVDSYVPVLEILNWVEDAALQVAEQGHLLHIRTEERGFLMIDQLNVASLPVIERIAGEGFEIPSLVVIVNKPEVGESQPLPRDAEQPKATGWDEGRYVEPEPEPASDLKKMVPVSEVVQIFNALAEHNGYSGAVAYVKEDGTGGLVQEAGIGQQFAIRVLLPLFNYGPLGLDRSKCFEVTQEAYALLTGLCFTEEYLSQAGDATNEQPFPGDLEARLGIALAEVRGAAPVESEGF